MSIAKGCLVIGLEAPHRISRCDSGLFDLLNYTADEVVGRSLRFLCGPETNATRIRQALKDAGVLTPSDIHVKLYDREGQGRNMCASFSPFFEDSGNLAGCLVTLENSQAIKF